jgi:DNA (cytosine-5)-methyltransferase 1
VKIGSLFAGIGGFDLAAWWMGWETAWFSEIDPYASAVMAHHFPEAKALGDIRTIRWEEQEWVDLMCGGFPCQDLSVAGRRKGLAGERSGLWSEYARAVRELRPRWVVIENVPPLLTGGFAVVRGDLRAAGYRVARSVLMSASAVGAPHRRERLWIVAHATGTRQGTGERRTSGPLRDAAWGEESERLGCDVADAESNHRGNDGLTSTGRQGAAGGNGRARGGGLQTGIVGGGGGAQEDVADAEGQPERAGLCESQPPGEWGRRLGDGDCTRDAWAVEPDVGRVAHGVPARVDRLAGLGNAIVPHCALAIFREIAKAEASQGTTGGTDGP